jgi:DNA-binding response OmpR family regulator
MRDYVRRLLAERYDVRAVADGQAAWEAAQEAAPDLVLADVMMPGLDGFGLLRRLRADPRTREAPIVLLSARAGEESRIEGLQAGADDYLVKPFSAKELLARVQAHLGLAKLRREAEEAIKKHNARLRLLWEAAGVLLTTNEPDAMLRGLFPCAWRHAPESLTRPPGRSPGWSSARRCAARSRCTAKASWRRTSRSRARRWSSL